MDGKEIDLQRRLDAFEGEFRESNKHTVRMLEQIKQAITGSLDGEQEGVFGRLKRLEESGEEVCKRLTTLETDASDSKVNKRALKIIWTTVGLIGGAGIWKIVGIVVWISKGIK